MRAGQTLAWIALPDHCGMIPVVSAEGGRLTWHRLGLLSSVASGEVVAVVGEPDAQVEEADPRRRLVAELERLEHEASARGASPLARHLLSEERKLAGERREQLRRALDAAAGGS